MRQLYVNKRFVKIFDETWKNDMYIVKLVVFRFDFMANFNKYSIWNKSFYPSNFHYVLWDTIHLKLRLGAIYKVRTLKSAKCLTPSPRTHFSKSVVRPPSPYLRTYFMDAPLVLKFSMINHIYIITVIFYF